MTVKKVGAASFSSVDMTTETLRQIKDRAENDYKVIPFPIKGITEYFGPLFPGHLCVVQAQTTNGKSLLIDQWGNFIAKNLIDHKANEVVIKVDLETWLEDHGRFEFSKRTEETVQRLNSGKIQDWEKLMDAVFDINSIGLYRIAYSERHIHETPDLSVGNCLKELEYLKDVKYKNKLTFAAIFVDYLQALEYDSSDDNDRRLKVRKDIYALRQWGQIFKCPIIVGVQAKQHLSGADSKNMYIPGIYDGEETSSIAQRADRIISLWMPKVLHDVGHVISYRGDTYRVTEDMIFVKINKQRGNLPSGAKWLCRVDYATGEIHMVEKL